MLSQWFSTWLYIRIICSPFKKFWCLGPNPQSRRPVGLRGGVDISMFLEVPRWVLCAARAKFTGLEKHGSWDLSRWLTCTAALRIPSWASVERRLTIANWNNAAKGSITCSEGHKMVSQCKVSTAATINRAKVYKKNYWSLLSMNLAVNHGFSPWVKSITFKHKWSWFINFFKKFISLWIHILLEKKSRFNLPTEA